MNSMSVDDITRLGAGTISLQQRVPCEVRYVHRPSESGENSLVFISSVAQLEQALKLGAKAFILLQKSVGNCASMLSSHHSVWHTNNIQKAMSALLPHFDLKSQFLKPGVHPLASIHPTAVIAPTAHIGAYAVIEAYALVGEQTIIYPHVYIGHYCEIGNHCLISAHTTIGSDGFGFFTDSTGLHHKIPQIGRVIIEDHCELGSHCAIDRATLHETRIKSGSKFDNFCHIAHNVEIGENALVAAGFMAAGSAKIGRNFTASGGVHTLGHLQIADGVILSARAGVTQSIEKSGVYGGYPLESHKESVKTLVTIPHIKKMRKQINKIIRHLNLQDADEKE